MSFFARLVKAFQLFFSVLGGAQVTMQTDNQTAPLLDGLKGDRLMSAQGR